jgi:hypothetical protein
MTISLSSALNRRPAIENSHQEAESAPRRQRKQTLFFQKLTDTMHAQCGYQHLFETTATQSGQAFGVSQCQLLTGITVPMLQLDPSPYQFSAQPTSLSCTRYRRPLGQHHGSRAIIFQWHSRRVGFA